MMHNLCMRWVGRLMLAILVPVYHRLNIVVVIRPTPYIGNTTHYMIITVRSNADYAVHAILNAVEVQRDFYTVNY